MYGYPMSRSGHPSINTTERGIWPISTAVGEHGTTRGFSLPLYGALIFAGIRVLSLATAAFLLPRGKFRELHCSLPQLIRSWDSGRYLIIAVHGYRHGSNLVWFPGYPAAIRVIAWIPGVSPVRAGLGVTIAAGLVAAWGLTRLGMALTGDRRASLIIAALWAVAPGSIVLSMLYAEALFCALAVWSLIALVERHWLTAAGLTILAGSGGRAAAGPARPARLLGVCGLGNAPAWRMVLARKERAERLRLGTQHNACREGRDH